MHRPFASQVGSDASPSPTRGRLLAIVTASLLLTGLASVPHATANHPQTVTTPQGTFSIQFDHDGDNEWWVEVLVRGAEGDGAVTVEARAESGPYHHLQAKAVVDGWSKWGTNTQDQFRVPPGDRVKFRAFVIDNVTGNGGFVESCFFTHPQGVEQCDTPPPPGEFDATFSGVKGNNWWVEVRVSANEPLAGVDARVNCADPWRPLELKSWGSWAASFHIPTGSKVDFRARSTDGDQDLSQGYTWTSATPTSGCGEAPPPPPPGEFDATFSGVKGNNWWVETKVTANQPLAGVDARINCADPWRPLELKSWGSWAASFHIPTGSKVDFRARSSGGAHDLSGGYVWPEATPTSACGSTPPPPPGAYFASFSGVKGNAWWIEAKVSAEGGPVNAVDARVNGGTWVAMTLRSWGAWAVSTHAPEGSLVEFRVRGQGQQLDFSQNGWTWTAATLYPNPAESGPTFNVKWHNVKGNAGWAQVNTYSNERLSRVDLRIDDGAWHEMVLQTYGDWTRAISIPNGSYVQFRATDFGGGRTLLSPEFVWPSLREVKPWPSEGSFVRYEFRDGVNVPDGSYSNNSAGVATFTFRSGAWRMDCSWTWEERIDFGATVNRGSASVVTSDPPPTGPLNRSATTNVTIPWMRSPCSMDEREVEIKGIENRGTELRDPAGRRVELMAWHGGNVDWQDECACQGNDAYWETRKGLMLDWWFGGRVNSDRGWIVATDAPVY